MHCPAFAGQCYFWGSAIAPPQETAKFVRMPAFKLAHGRQYDSMGGMTIAKLLIPTLVALASVCSAAPMTEAGRTAQEAARQYGAAVRNCDMGWALDSMYPPLKRTYADRYGNSGNPEAEAADARRIMGTSRESTAAAQARMRANERALRNRYVKMGQDMKAAGFKVEDFSVGAPFAEYELTPSGSLMKQAHSGAAAEELDDTRDRSRIIILPTRLTYSVPDRNGRRTRVLRKGYIFALRDELISAKVNERGTQLNRWYFADGNTNINMLRAFFPDLPLNIDLPDSGDYPLN